MKKTIEITKNTEYYARVRDNEDVDDAIIRFMDKNGFETEVWTDGKGLKHRYYYRKSDGRSCWVGARTFNEDTKKVRFEIDGNI